ncbi:copper resistance protein CopD [Capnocytophaga sp. ARDL2]|uniref:copper resistance protein CopD n=1 Tax=Capnocytophaga sp. ARDL2 TaxID=3238809 RepID=UPI0035564C18
MNHHLLLVLHLLGAAIWVGGHIVLAVGILPNVLKKKDPQILLDFERKYEKIGMPALLILVTTGIAMAYRYNMGFSTWFSFSNAIETVISLKLILLIITVLFALSANFFVLPNLSSKKLPMMAFHIVSVTLIGIVMLVLGSFVRFGGINL